MSSSINYQVLFASLVGAVIGAAAVRYLYPVDKSPRSVKKQEARRQTEKGQEASVKEPLGKGNENDILCKCNKLAVRKTSRSEKNPGRDYLSCANVPYSSKCKFFKWCDGTGKPNTVAKFKTVVLKPVGDKKKAAKKTGSKFVLTDGVVVDLETTIPRKKGAKNEIIEVGALRRERSETTPFNIMVDFDLEAVALEDVKALRERLDAMGQNTNYTLKFWDEFVLMPKFGWSHAEMVNKLSESRAKWAELERKHGGEVPCDFETVLHIQKTFGDWFFFPQKFAINALLRFTEESSSQLWYAHNGDKFDFKVLEQTARRSGIPLFVNRLFGTGKPAVDKQSIVVDGFDTLKFLRKEVGKGWKTSSKSPGYSQESLYARYRSKFPQQSTRPEGSALPRYQAHNAADDCVALLELLLSVEKFLSS
jgi:DNA polymerase III epsilon subunit-like protein